MKLILNLLLITCFVLPARIFSQAYKISYSLTTIFDGEASRINYEQIANSELNFALFRNIENDEQHQREIQSIDFSSHRGTNFTIYRPKDSLLVSTSFISGKLFNIKEKLPLYHPQKTGDKREVLGHTCEAYRIKFRGRIYRVWVTTELGIIGGIWKFVQFPGYALAAYSEDGEIAYEASNIRLLKALEDSALENVKYRLTDFVSWEEYVDLFIENEKRLRKHFRAESDEDVQLSHNTYRVEKIQLPAAH